MSDADVLIVGGGISGLTIGWLLANAGASVEVWEQSDNPGGKIQTQRRCGYLLEDSASMVLNFRPEVNRFLDAAGLKDHKLERAPTEHRFFTVVIFDSIIFLCRHNAVFPFQIVNRCL